MTPDKIRERRLARGYTQGQAARRMGVDARSWRYWEAGTHQMPAAVCIVLRALTEVRGFRAWLERQQLGK